MNKDINFLLSLLLFFIIFLCTMITAEYHTCNNQYKDTQYNIFGGCMVKYNGEYIPEELYIKAFEQNLIIK